MNDTIAVQSVDDLPIADLRTAARVIRRIALLAEVQLKAMSWWKRIGNEYPKEYLEMIVFNLETLADEKQRIQP